MNRSKRLRMIAAADIQRVWSSRAGNWTAYLQGLALVAVATALGKLAPDFFAPVNLIMVYLLSVVVTAFLWGYGPSVVVCVVSVLVFDFVFIPPVFTFAVSNTKYLFTFVVMLLVGLAISYLMARIRDEAEAALRRERQTSALFSLERDLAVSSSLESHITAILQRLRDTFGRDAVVFLPSGKGENGLVAHPDIPDAKVGESERALAAWCFQHLEILGSGTKTLPDAGARYLPLFTGRGAIGVLALFGDGSSGDFTAERGRLLGAYADLAAVAIEGAQLLEETRNAQVSSRVMRETEKLQTALLNSVSHDLRTPLVSIIGTLSSLQEEGITVDDGARKNMVQVAREEAERLNRLITNLLDVSRLEAGAVRINRQPSDVQDIIGTALEQLSSRTKNRPITIDMPQDAPFVSVDFTLIVQTLVNVLDNALKYSPPGSTVEIKARYQDKELRIEVADRGIGIPPQDLSHVFDKFYRVQRPEKVAGTGLGLSICKGIVEAHGGSITAQNRDGGGTIFTLTLPVDEKQRWQRFRNTNLTSGS